MSPMTFTDWRRSKLHQAATRTQDGRRTGDVTLTLADSTATSSPGSGQVTFTLIGPADIAGLTAGTICRRAPGPNEHAAETTKCVHVDFADEDFCWRYTPKPTEQTEQLRPWLALLVGTEDEIRLAGGQATIARILLNDHPLEDSYRWAHQMTDGSRRISRLISPMTLKPQTKHTAVLVAAFDRSGRDAWSSAGPNLAPNDMTLPVLDSWSFTTNEAGDFKTMAQALRIRSTPGLGLATLRYQSTHPSMTDATDTKSVRVGGALASLTLDQPLNEETDAIKEAEAHLEGLTASLKSLHHDAEWGEPIAIPTYGPPWADPATALADDPSGTGWLNQLRTDLPSRSQAGLGLWMGVDGQDELMKAAVEQAGALLEAAGMVRHLAAGVDASSRLWDRHLPTDKRERLAVLGPMLTQLVTKVGNVERSAVDSLCGPDSLLERGLFSGAAQRLSGFGMRRLLELANEPPQPAEVPAPPPESLQDVTARLADEVKAVEADWEFVDAPLKDFAEAVKGLAQETAEVNMADPEKRSVLGTALLKELTGLLDKVRGRCSSDDIMRSAAEAVGLSTSEEFALLLVFTPRPETLIYTVLLDRIRICRGDRTAETRLRRPMPSQRKQMSLDKLSDAISDLVDPHGDWPPALAQVTARITGIDVTSMAPLNYPLGIDFPSWSLLQTHDPEWLLPGVSAVPADTICALRTNPEFIDAYMVGLNTQFLAEARWRGLPVTRTITPLRMFWGPTSKQTNIDPRAALNPPGHRQSDIMPLDTWRATEGLGDPNHQATRPANARQLVLLFNTPLFRRYPGTVVYLVEADADLSNQELADRLNDPAFVIKPVFVGSIKPDLFFFIFDVDPDRLTAYWLVLDEPAADLRFRLDKFAILEKLSPYRSSEVAETLLDHQTRVAISGAE